MISEKRLDQFFINCLYGFSITTHIRRNVFHSIEVWTLISVFRSHIHEDMRDMDFNP